MELKSGVSAAVGFLFLLLGYLSSTKGDLATAGVLTVLGIIFLLSGNSLKKDIKKPWFHFKKYGYGWGLPARWQGWVVLLLYFVFIIFDFLQIDSHSHSASDTLYNFIPEFIVASVVLIVIVRISSGKPKWRWGSKK